MRIIFLDIDGVLNSELLYTKKPKRNKAQSREDYHLSNIDERNVAYLNSLIEETRAKVVISSTWRLGNTKEYLQQLLSKKGFIGEIIGFTPSLRHEGCVRGNEIYHWIDKNAEMLCGSRVGSDFKEYVIFDDDTDMLLWQQYNFIKVDPYCGLTPNNCYKAKFILCRDMTFTNSFNNDKKQTP